MAKALAGTQFLLAIREFTLERNHIDVKNVEKLSVSMQLLLNTSEFILKRSLINVRIVIKTVTQHIGLTYHHIIHTEGNLINVRKPAKALIRDLTSLDIRERVLEGNPSNEVRHGRGLS